MSLVQVLLRPLVLTLVAGTLFVGLPEAAAQVPGAPKLDTFLPESLRAAVEAAALAELDPKRGPGNAIAALKTEREKHARAPALQLALDLRIAATGLRQRFLSRRDAPEPVRYEQALSTFARLDLAEPGLAGWLQQTLAHSPGAARKLGPKGQRVIEAALLVRGSEIDKAAAERALAAPFSRLGYPLRFVPARNAPWVMKLAVSSERSSVPGEVSVRVSLGLENIRDGKVAWQSEAFRVEQAKTAEAAIAQALVWLSRIGGRDLFFRWLGERGLPGLLGPGPVGADPHGHHGHGPPGLPPDLRGGQLAPRAPAGPRGPERDPHGH